MLIENIHVVNDLVAAEWFLDVCMKHNVESSESV